MNFPVLGVAYPSFEQRIDISAVALGAALVQQGHVITYASQPLAASERNHSVIQCECLAIAFALKQFHHYLLGRPFLLDTDHASFQWVSAQKWRVCCVVALKQCMSMISKLFID